ncbi:RspO [Pseudomonas sp. R2-7-07]|nr:RspO [Pseudomonas sp. R2-7-07]
MAHIQQAQDLLEKTRQEEQRQCAQLLSEHQGQVVSVQALKSWNRKEQSLSAGTRREEGQVQQLQGQQEQREVEIGIAQKHVTQCLRQVEKLQELANLLTQEPL